MRLVIDCFKLIKGTGKSLGIYNVALGLVKHLGAMRLHSDNTAGNEIIILGNQFNQDDFDVPGVHFINITRYNPTKKMHLVMWELFYVSKVCKKLGADTVFFPRGFNALTHPVYDVVLIHDLIPFFYKESFPKALNRLENAYIMKRLKMSARTAKKIITISQASKADIIKYCRVDESKVKVIYNACEYDIVAIAKDDKHEPYICAMTSSLPHKNAKGVVEAYLKYYEQTKKPLKLVIIGLQDLSSFDIPDSVKKHVVCYKYIKDDHELKKIIGGSEVFLFLSLIEGFGLPPIEAMSMGVPVICSNLSSLPEVVGEAAVLVDPLNPEEVAEKISLVLSNDQLRTQLKNKGEDNIKRFSWPSCSSYYWQELIDSRK